MPTDLFHVIDFGDSFILFSGTIDECGQVLDESYGGLFLVADQDLPEGFRSQLINVESPASTTTQRG
jgi:hypothetical protein